MTSKLFILFFVAIGLSSCGSTKTSKKSASISIRKPLKVKTVRTTAYTHTEADHLAYSNKNAVGTNLRYGRTVRSAAADWSKYPVGTCFQIVGIPSIYIIDDYGSALVGKDVIDLYKPTAAHMNKWGARNVQIKILKWGSYEKSLQILKGRESYKHVRQMVSGIKKKV